METTLLVLPVALLQAALGSTLCPSGTNPRVGCPTASLPWAVLRPSPSSLITNPTFSPKGSQPCRICLNCWPFRFKPGVYPHCSHYACMLCCFGHAGLFAVAHQVPPSVGLSRHECGVGCHAPSRRSFRSRDGNCVSCVSCVGRWILDCRATWEAAGAPNPPPAHSDPQQT